MSVNRAYAVGALCVATYIAVAAVREVFFAVSLRAMNIYVLIAFVFSLTSVFFMTLQGRNIGPLLTRARSHARDLIYINLTTAVAWFSFIVSLLFIEPAVATSIIAGLGPLATLFIGSVMLRNAPIRRLDVVCAVGTVASVLLLGYVTIAGKSAVKVDSTLLAAVGLLGAIVSGSASAANNVVAKRLSLSGFSAREVMALRFYLLIAGALVWIGVKDVPFAISSQDILMIAAISFFGISIPLYLLQIGIARIDVHSTALIIAAGPLITYATQSLVGGFTTSVFSLVGVCLALSFVVVGIVGKLHGVKN